MIKNYLGSLIARQRRALKEQKGQSIIIVTFAFLGLIGMLGIALDLGLVYIERVKIGRTTDAAALAAVVELPYEEEAMRRAIEYIRLNGYNAGVDTQILVRGCISYSGQFRNVDGKGVLSPSVAVPVTYTNAISGYPYPGIPSVANPRAIFVIDTLAYQPVDRAGNVVTTHNDENCDSASKVYGKANKLRVSGEVMVDMNFMQFFGFREVPVQDVAVGENVTSLDIAVVFDVSGSMDYETNCFGCWREYPTGHANHDPVAFPFPANGATYPAHYDPYQVNGAQSLYVPSSNLCTAGVTPVVRDGYSYLAHEAEYYSRNDAAGSPQGWNFDRRSPGQGFWVLQRADRGSNYAHIRAHPYVTYSQSSASNFPQLQGMAYDSECFDETGQCWRTRGQSLNPIETAPAISTTVPFVEYDFKVSWNQATQIWVRAQEGSTWANEWTGQSPSDFTTYRKAIFWRVDSLSTRGGNFNNLVDGALGDLSHSDASGQISFSMSDANWRWIKLGGESLAQGQHTLRIYQGSTGFNIDKVVITNNPWGNVGDAFGNTGARYGSASTTATGYASIRDTLQLNGGRGPDATQGSATREACNVCNPIFGGQSTNNPTVSPSMCSCKTSSTDNATNPFFPAGGSGIGCSGLNEETNMLSNDLYHDVDPLRSAQEAVKNFATRLDPRFDQIGVVAFTGGSGSIRDPRMKLQCLIYAQKVLNDGRECFDENNTPITYTKVIRALEDHNPDNTTDIPTGMREGLEELGLDINNPTTIQSGACSNNTSTAGDGKSCDRGGAAKRILILMTDGSPNLDDNCPASNLWRGRYGKGNQAYDCSVYYAREAANSFVTVYTIGIGSGVNIELLSTMAEGTDPNPDPSDPQKGYYFESRGGKFYRAAKPSDLDTIFEDILDNIFVRIVG